MAEEFKSKGYMERVARMLGVELGEEFALEDDEDGGRYVFYADGVHEIKDDTKISALCVGLLNSLLIGGRRIKEKPFYPYHNQICYCTSICAEAVIAITFTEYNQEHCAMRAAGLLYKNPDIAEARFAEDYAKLTGKQLSSVLLQQHAKIER